VINHQENFYSDNLLFSVNNPAELVLKRRYYCGGPSPCSPLLHHHNRRDETTPCPYAAATG
jgi:hypothetical protein